MRAVEAPRSYASPVDPSVLIFVALAAAWAAYLVPKALQHHDAAQRSRSVERFSRSMRVLARREVVDRRNARLVVQPGRAPSASKVETKARAAAPQPARPVSPAARRAAAKRATQRRQRVLALIGSINAAVIGPAIGGVISPWWVIAPVALLAAWLVACRLMVKSERAARGVRESMPTVPPRASAPDDSAIEDGADDETGAIAVVEEELVEAPEVVVTSSLIEVPAASTGEFSAVTASTPGLWDPVPTTLPTYVSKPAAARRTVSTIDLDSTGVWSSGRNEIDSALAREAEQIAKVAKAAEESSERRASGA